MKIIEFEKIVWYDQVVGNSNSKFSEIVPLFYEPDDDILSTWCGGTIGGERIAAVIVLIKFVDL